MWVKESDRVKQEAGDTMVILLQDWKNRLRRYRIYRRCLWVALVLCSVGLLGFGYYCIDSSIPSVIRLRAGQEQSFDLNLPARAELVSVSEQGESNIPRESITIDLTSPVTMKAGSLEAYQMEVKLFGFLPFKQVGIQVIEDTELIPVGVPIGIYVKTEGLLVIGIGEFTGMDGMTYSPSRYVLRSGDYIHQLNGQPVSDKEDFIWAIEEGDGKEIVLVIERDGEEQEVRIQPIRNQSGSYKIGAWIRDNAQGVGTMTYIDSEGHFGALGHGINDVDTSTLMDMDDGTLYQTEIISIRKGTIGNPGEMTGMIVYSDDRILGDITSNSVRGIFGTCNEKALALGTEDPMPIGLKQEIQKGSAQILCTVDGTARYYDIEITAIHLDHDNVNRGIELTVTDPELLELTGGIVQGMSGAPIIQSGRLIGAITHVLVQDSTKGYGIFIESMLEQ